MLESVRSKNSNVTIYVESSDGTRMKVQSVTSNSQKIGEAPVKFQTDVFVVCKKM